MDLKQFVENIKRKKIGKNQILILFLCGVLLMIIAMPVKEKEDSGEYNKRDKYEIVQHIEVTENTEYAQYLEGQLENILSMMEGAGEVACMVTLSQSAERIIEKDTEISDDMVEETDSQGGERITKQSGRSETTVYNEKENGSPYVSKQISPKVEGVLVLSEGGDNAVVSKNITEAIQALFGIPPHKIRIVKKGG